MHVHLYRQYPPKKVRDWVGCMKQPDVPDLVVGDEIEYEGVVYGALPGWKGDVIDVQRDDYMSHSRSAQVATPLPKVDDDEYEKTKELIGAGGGSGFDNRWPGAV